MSEIIELKYRVLLEILRLNNWACIDSLVFNFNFDFLKDHVDKQDRDLSYFECKMVPLFRCALDQLLRETQLDYIK